MEARISKIEKEMALISQATQSISKTLGKMSDMYTDGKVLEAKVATMDKELIDSFARINEKIDKNVRDRDWLIKIILTAVIIGVLNLVVHPFSEG